MRRLELVILDLIHHASSRTALGWGKYPWGVHHAIESLLPLVSPDDPAKSSIDKGWEELNKKLGG